MMIPGTNVALTIPDEAALGILATALSALAKSSKTNSPIPVGILLRERLSMGERRALNMMLHALGQACAKQGKKKRKAVPVVKTPPLRPKVVLDDSQVPLEQRVRSLRELLLPHLTNRV